MPGQNKTFPTLPQNSNYNSGGIILITLNQLSYTATDKGHASHNMEKWTFVITFKKQKNNNI